MFSIESGFVLGELGSTKLIEYQLSVAQKVAHKIN